MIDETFDSTKAALEAQREAWRRLGPIGRLRLAVEMSEQVRRVALAGEHSRHPSAPPEEIERNLVRRLYGVG